MDLKPKNKILIFFQGDSQGGIDTMLLSLIPELNKHFRVILATVHDSQLVNRIVEKESMAVYKIPLNKPLLGFGFFHLVRLIYQEKIDIIFSIELVVSVLIRPIKIFFPHLKHVTSICCDGRMFNRNSQFWFNAFFLFSNKKTSFLIDKYLCISKFLADSYLKEEGIPAKRLQHIYCGLEPEITQKRRPQIRAPFKIGYLGRRSQEKGFDIFIEVVKKLREERNSLQFNYAGAGSFYSREAEELSKQFPAFLVNHGYLTKVTSFYQQMDCMLIPSRSEGFCYTVLECFNFGVPVICSAVGSLPELIIDRQNGLLCRSGDVADFVEAIKNLQSNPDLKNKLAETGSITLKQFTLEKMCQNYATFFKEL